MFNPGTLAMLIPIFALSIPIVAILADAYKKSHRNSPETAKKIEALEKRIHVLENMMEGKLTDLRSDVTQLEEKQQFIQRLLDDK
ncbi:MAG: hypothetical protein JW760_05615 [Spirochaetales bacterium]|nr:hypothetical protein [Spirochaetales bacterium]